MKLPIRRSRAAEPAPDADMTLVGHLSELRTRLIRSVLAIVVAAALIWIFFNQIFTFMAEPYCELYESQADNAAVDELVSEEDCAFLIQSPLESFSVVLAVAGYGGVLMAMPVILYQLGRFVLPGLYPEERRVLLPFVAVSVILLLLGVVSGYLLMPKTLSVLLSFGSDQFVAVFSPQEYISFMVKMLLAFGVTAELPLVLVFLQLIGIVPTEVLRSHRRLAVVAVVILAAVVTPTGDPFNLVVLAVPMYLFFEVALLVGGRMTRHRRAVGA